ncbi:hypothetical protein ABIA32_002334 [Streptacidiphilus sp. MAP12-20]|uniref:hypothetical protein n=1 Tax=Streptacidiphilus sp. MAP12-20 TaxID=3156299 RepID=UPI0035165E79
MSTHGTSARKTAKATRKDSGARVTAQALSTGRGPKAQGKLTGGVAAAPAPAAASPGGEAIAAKEHTRRDIGSRQLVFQLGAADAPASASGPFTSPDGVPMRFAAHCLTHAATKYFADPRQATRAAKASHTWCTGCAEALAGHTKHRSGS